MAKKAKTSVGTKTRTKAKKKVARDPKLPVGSFFLGFRRANSRDGRPLKVAKRAGVSAMTQRGLALTGRIDTSDGKFKMLGTGGHPLGPLNKDFEAMEILYHRLHISETFDYDYLDDSGIYRNASSEDDPITYDMLTDFIGALEDGDPDGATWVNYSEPLYNQAHGAPHVLLKEKSFVVVELVADGNMTLSTSVPAIDTAENRSDRYFGLEHVDMAGDSPMPSPAGKKCLIFYFSADEPLEHENHSFNIYLQVDTLTSIVLMTVDPFIKNRGGH